MASGSTFVRKLQSIVWDGLLGKAFSNGWVSWNLRDLFTGMIIAVLFRLLVHLKAGEQKKYRRYEEYGSARWGGPKDIAPFIDPVFENNVILSWTEFLTMNSRPLKFMFARNKNVLIVGGSGSGKTRFWLKPNLLQMHCSYVITDPKGYNNIGQRKSHTVRRKSSAMWLFLYPI